MSDSEDLSDDVAFKKTLNDASTSENNTCHYNDRGDTKIEELETQKSIVNYERSNDVDDDNYNTENKLEKDQTDIEENEDENNEEKRVSNSPKSRENSQVDVTHSDSENDRKEEDSKPPPCKLKKRELDHQQVGRDARDLTSSEQQSSKHHHHHHRRHHHNHHHRSHHHDHTHQSNHRRRHHRSSDNKDDDDDINYRYHHRHNSPASRQTGRHHHHRHEKESDDRRQHRKDNRHNRSHQNDRRRSKSPRDRFKGSAKMSVTRALSPKKFVENDERWNKKNAKDPANSASKIEDGIEKAEAVAQKLAAAATTQQQTSPPNKNDFQFVSTTPSSSLAAAAAQTSTSNDDTTALDPLKRATQLAAAFQSKMAASKLASLAVDYPSILRSANIQDAQRHQALEMKRQVEARTGVEIPNFYNPSAVNAQKFAETIQKRKLLWAKNPGDKKAEFNKSVWTSTSMVASGGDGEAAKKFRKLMGIRGDDECNDKKSGDKFDAARVATTNSVMVAEEKQADVLSVNEEEREKQTTTNSKDGGDTSIRQPNSGSSSNSCDEMKRYAERQAALFKRLDAQYESARTHTHLQRGVGLGYSQQAAFLEQQQMQHQQHQQPQ